MDHSPRVLSTLAISLSLLLTACGSSDSDDDSVDVLPPPPPIGQCSAQDQNQQLIGLLRRDYLWNDDLPANINPASYPTPYHLLDDVLPPQDRFSFILTEQEYEDIYINAVFFGMGFGRQDDTNTGVIRVRYVYENSPADRAGLTRGSAITAINGIAMSEWYSRLQNGTATWDDVFGPNEDGIEVALEWTRPDGTEDNDTLRKTEVETNTVMAVERFTQGDQDIGYFVFDSFINRAENDVNDAFDQFIGVDELIIDLRYNSGGLIRIANQIASQASWDYVENETFVTYRFNDNYYDEEVLFDLGRGIERLNLERVVVLTTGASCSSSEMIINSLDPFVDVVTVGQPTCGKPVGQMPTQFCDKILFAINFQTVNADGYGDYFDGLQPTCSARDTVLTDWADPADPLLGEALHYLQNGSCSAPAGVSDLQLYNATATGPESAHLLIPEQPAVNPLLDKYQRHH